MIDGLYRVGAGMSTKMVRMEILANNLANIETLGFKRDRAFSEELDAAAAQSAADGSGDLVIHQVVDYSEGSLKQTNNQLDLAIQGRGFFVLDTPSGPRYTRNGNFQLGLDGTILSSGGYPVSGTNGKLQLPDVHRLTQGSVQVSETGEVTVDKQIVGQLRVVDFQDYTQLMKDDQALFTAPAEAGPVEGPGRLTGIRQGYVEESNVEGIEEMVSMIDLSRSFEAEQKAIQTIDTSLGQSNEVGKM
jgi:flagellar basal-body rod protein FlgF